ncbi:MULTISPECIES: Maf family protein [Bosea]|uniref:Maf family protein n=1 Tax=Bosea TaxID=85413 RepID=UPI00214F6DDC|nr:MULTISPECIES: Maf family protein [Bosea]MCR4524357.1 Maf family protein [Bosea sp. 47.2.35]MDR6831379.1 septum formation protein [Bosea robiniae]MDR6898118.1 septum formation protein [Bosea sp. BE109]MDR7141515.1 septum formation protein [Bosea sp. BE168]MDR7178147.1 septum formation protein [Bosea sp. BE271]
MNASSGLWLAAEPLILASGSATRRDMLLAAGIPVEVVKPDIDERAVEKPLVDRGVPADQVAAALACAKALAVSRDRPGRLVLAADQTLTCDGVPFHKPVDMVAAERQITALAGRTHELHSAVVIARNGAPLAEELEAARLTMRPLQPEFIARYLAVAGSAALSSVGGYQIEGPGAQLFDRIEGDHFTILGLPLLAVLTALRDLDCLAR